MEEIYKLDIKIKEYYTLINNEKVKYQSDTIEDTNPLKTKEIDNINLKQNLERKNISANKIKNTIKKSII